jgi:hypothetical protein
LCTLVLLLSKIVVLKELITPLTSIGGSGVGVGVGVGTGVDIGAGVGASTTSGRGFCGGLGSFLAQDATIKLISIHIEIINL